MPSALRASLYLLLATVAIPALASEPPPDAARAGALCHEADRAAGGEKRALLERGLAAAERAVAANEADAAGHFAVFCNLGKLTRLDGLSPRSLFALRRLRREVDRTLELAPNHTGALVGKAALLYYSPRLLGGDPAEGVHFLRAALLVDPDMLDARLALARALAERGERGEAVAAAREALQRATYAHPAHAAEARGLLDALAR
jgi:hypothetical protein